MNNEGALIAFTLLSQMIIGSTLVYAMVFFLGAEDLSQVSTGFSLRTPEFLLLIGILVATMISFLHLGKPGNAVNALNNLKTSWISREILTLSLFSVSLFLLFIARWLGGGRLILNLSFACVVLAGILFLVSMIRLYMIPEVSTWNSWLTPAGFLLATLISGMILLLLYSSFLNLELLKLKPVVLVIIGILLMEAVHAVSLMGTLNSMNLSFGNPFIMDGIFRSFTIIRLALIGLAMAFLLMVLPERYAGIQSTMLLLSFTFIILELVLGRFIFFASYLRVGI